MAESDYAIGARWARDRLDPFIDELIADLVACMNENQRMRRDISDMNASPQTLFVRCACGRIRSQGLICPTVAEGGECEQGR